ncbi:DUF6531 domain-containing protein [Thauera sinica]|uniref:DUF6531 domain-containing protein n=1 Tax=Thauera sp. K11 TaxID=2005884 RepID=UPI003FCD3309
MVTGNLIHTSGTSASRAKAACHRLERWYNSKNPKDGPLGYGWTHSFNHFIRFYGGGIGHRQAWLERRHRRASVSSRLRATAAQHQCRRELQRPGRHLRDRSSASPTASTGSPSARG